MRQINVSTEVFARLWSLRLDGEETEDDILRRLLFGPSQHSTKAKIESELSGRGGVGVYDARHGLQFPEGFEIQWRYKGITYYAVAAGGCWCRSDTDEKFRTLNELTASISDSPQNAWTAWSYINLDGMPESIHHIRIDGGAITPAGEVKCSKHPTPVTVLSEGNK